MIWTHTIQFGDSLINNSINQWDYAWCAWYAFGDYKISFSWYCHKRLLPFRWMEKKLVRDFRCRWRNKFTKRIYAPIKISFWINYTEKYCLYLRAFHNNIQMFNFNMNYDFHTLKVCRSIGTKLKIIYDFILS